MNKERVLEKQKLFESISQAQLGYFPTPIYKVNKISEELGVELYLKRDDITGPSVFGGNKIRKLEFLLGDAIDKGSSYIITHGATQSNHAMQTATACNKLGLNCILYLLALVSPDMANLKSNLLLDKVLGAETNIIELEGGMTEAEGEKIAHEKAKERIKELESEGKFCYEIPVGGSTPVGTLGFIKGLFELYIQLEENHVGDIDYLFVTAGSGGTLAGILAGISLLDSDTNVIGIAASPKGEEYKERVVGLANDALKLLGVNETISRDSVKVDTNYVGKGYEIPTEEASNAIKYFARKEGIILDPVYTGKAMSGLIDYVKSGIIPQGSKVVFWHTGGGTGLFAEKEIVGDIFD
ncbi:D-cysteine desulfhydrase family protein [Anaerosalibacter bizertensis]|uniref:1-aminocyclopropane-1-carboxylate deaminase/D-cysteine desulfhydrase n=1 Tax=Anaerosalibacter bizertensis TaxID=932217 RepID=UPI001C0EAFB7|nr:D-cysteine desulfhydrase family protein [Anaerosalibacter bizertensis]MBU5294365.1 D-cysteine desulfhydrase family protein [Anaerosalibacter bizertensis]